jgi:hypothetical protein
LDVKRSTALLLLALSGFALWSSYQLFIRAAVMTRQQAQIKSLTNQLFAATTELDEFRRRLDTVVEGRIPGLLPFRVDEPISVDTPFVREISFKSATPPASGHQVKIVVENDSDARIRPIISVLIFDEVGAQVARVRLVDGRRDALRSGEIRSFSADFHTADGSVPRHFRIDSD